MRTTCSDAPALISIHTFLAEGDCIQYQIQSLISKFQSTPSLRKVTPHLPYLMYSQADFNPHLPCGRWRKLDYRIVSAIPISIHTFLAEGDFKVYKNDALLKISIHTFLAEGDYFIAPATGATYLFQSTPSLRKVTAQDIARLADVGVFQSTPSLRKVTAKISIIKFL